LAVSSKNMRRTTVPGSLRHTTHMEVGSAENAWSNFQSVHPWT